MDNKSYYNLTIDNGPNENYQKQRRIEGYITDSEIITDIFGEKI